MSARPQHRIARVGAGLAAVAALLVLPATAASAHVRVVPESTAAGGFSALTFRVPNESDTATTTQLVVDLPTDTPLLYVSTKPVPGWTAVVETGDLPEPVDVEGTTLTEAPLHITWTANDGVGIKDGEFQEFEVSGGPLPAEAGTDLVFPAHQTYSDGTVVDWDEVADGDEEPEHPAPMFTTTEATGGGHHGGAAADETAAADGTADGDAAAAEDGHHAESATASKDTLARVLGGAGLVLGVVAVIVALRRRSDAPAAGRES